MFRTVASAQFAFALFLSALAFGCAGCWSARTDNSVLVVLRGGSESARWQATEDLLPYLVDDPRDRLDNWSAWGGHPPEQIRLAPVADPKAFADRVRFGDVEKIEGRTIFIRVDDGRTATAAALARVIHFFQELPDRMRQYWFVARVKAIAWLTGQPEENVFWSVFSSDWGDPNQGVIRILMEREGDKR